VGWRALRLIADTNLLVRVLMHDDLAQAKLAEDALLNAEVVAISLTALCELGWVLSRSYKVPSPGIAEGMRRLINGANVSVNRPAVDAGLAQLDAGGDFADGVIAHEGGWLGGETFLTFDQKAVKLLEARGQSARLLT
jgi:predicted nucleic-acid-binding protein